MTEASGGAQLRFNISANASASGCVKGANVGDTHRREMTADGGELQVKLC
jgi:hypothetical protein